MIAGANASTDEMVSAVDELGKKLTGLSTDTIEVYRRVRRRCGAISTRPITKR